MKNKDSNAKRKAIHFSERQRLMDTAYQRRQTLNIRAWRLDGHKVYYKGWIVHHQYWKGGFVRIKNPVNGELRTLPEIFIYEINGLKIYL